MTWIVLLCVVAIAAAGATIGWWLRGAARDRLPPGTARQLRREERKRRLRLGLSLRARRDAALAKVRP